MLDRSISRYLSMPVFSIRAGANLDEALQRLERHGVSCLAVSEPGNELAGVITRSDLLAAGSIELDSKHGGLRIFLPEASVRSVAAPDVVKVDPETATVRDAAARMVDRGVHRVFAATATHVYGVLSTKDVLRALVDERVSAPVSEIMSAPIESIAPTTLVEAAVSTLKRAAVTGLVVVDEHGWPVGLFTQREALEARGYFSADSVSGVMSPRLITVASTTAIHYAAAQASAARARHAVVVDESKHPIGIVTGLDFARAAATYKRT